MIMIITIMVILMKTILVIQGSQPANAKYINIVHKQIPITPLASHNQQPEIYIIIAST